ncbi:MAG: hypothetical protein WAW07_08370 [Bacteroidales bacterium]
MKTIKQTLLFFILSCGAICVSSAQIIVPESDELLDKLRLNNSINRLNNVFYEDISGTPFMFKDFQTGEVLLKTGERYKADLRFDKYAGEMQFKVKEVVYAIALPESISLIEINGTRFIYTKTDNIAKYLEVLSDGKCKLLAEKKARIQDAELPKPYQQAKPARFIDLEDVIYLKLGDNNAVRIKNKKDLLTLMSDKKDQINDFIGDNKLKTKDIEDLKRIVLYYNGL